MTWERRLRAVYDVQRRAVCHGRTGGTRVRVGDGIGLIDVDAFTTLVVRTDNSVYRITILTPHLRELVVQGGKFFPERTRACLSRSTLTGIVGPR